MSKSKDRPVLNGLLFDIEDGEVNLVAADGFRMVHYPLQAVIEGKERVQVVVSLESLKKVLKGYGRFGSDEIWMHIGHPYESDVQPVSFDWRGGAKWQPDSWVQRSEDAEVIPGNYPSWRQLFDLSEDDPTDGIGRDSGPWEVSSRSGPLHEALSIAAKMGDHCRAAIEPTNLFFGWRNDHIANAVSVTAFSKCSGEFGVNPKLFMEMVKPLMAADQHKSVTMVCRRNSAMHLRFEGDLQYRALLMPLFVNDETSRQSILESIEKGV